MCKLGAINFAVRSAEVRKLYETGILSVVSGVFPWAGNLSKNRVIDGIRKDISSECKEQVELSVAIANRIYEILEIKGMNQKDLAQRLGKTETEVSRWLSGTHNLTLSTICKISTALGEDIVTVPQS